MPYNLTTMQSIFLNNKEITLIKHNNKTVYQKSSGPDYTEPFYVENLSYDQNTVYIKATGDAPVLEIYKSYDNSTFTLAGSTGDFSRQVTINIPAKSKVWLRCTANTWCNTTISSLDSNVIYANSEFAVGGNIMSLLYGADYSDKTSFPTTDPNTFKRLFAEADLLTDASKLVLPVTDLGTTKNQYCYAQMFYNCVSLDYAPALPATILTNYCYYQMFEGCEHLTSAPALPATILTNYCYYQMFEGCESLESAPALPATNLSSYCYYQMFEGCKSLISAPALPATKLASYCYYQMFEGCESLESAPMLPATKLRPHSYDYMFRYCTSLEKVICLADPENIGTYTVDWLDGVSTYGIFFVVPESTWRRGSSGIPYDWYIEDYDPSDPPV